MKRFLQSLGIVKNVFEIMKFFNDNQFATIYVKNLKYHGKTKHIDTKNNLKKDIIAPRGNDLEYSSTCKMVIDPFMKSIIRNMFSIHVKSLGLRRL